MHQLLGRRLELGSMLPRAIVVGSLSTACLVFVLTRKSKRRPRAGLPPEGTVSHVCVCSTDASRSVEFYERLGLVSLGAVPSHSHSDSNVLMRCPKAPKWQPLLLIKYDPRAVACKHSGEVGMGRVCFLVEDVSAELARLSALGIEPLAPPATDTSPLGGEFTIAGFHDPDGVVVELAQMHGWNRRLLALLRWVGVIEFPLWIHCNVNVKSYSRSLEAYRALGFAMHLDLGRVQNALAGALGIPGDPVGKHVAILKLPAEPMFGIDLIEWEAPVPVERRTADDALRSFAITVSDVPAALERLTTGGFRVAQPATRATLPAPLGACILGAVLDPDGVRIELVSYAAAAPATLSRPDGWVGAKLVLVTGCDSGIGRELVLQATGCGFRVVAACFTQVSAAAYESDGLALGVCADLSTPDGIANVVSAVRKAAGVDGLWAIVHNAGVCLPGNVEWLPPSAYERSYEIHCQAPVALTYELLPLLKSARGRVVNVTSVDGFVPIPLCAAYCASKHFLEAYSDCLRCEMLPWGVKVVVVEPSTMRTPLALSFGDAWLASYKAAPAERRAPYGDTWATTLAAADTQDLERAADDPGVTVAAILKALIDENPPTRMVTGKTAIIFKVISLLPDKTRDRVLYAMRFRGHTPAALATN